MQLKQRLSDADIGSQHDLHGDAGGLGLGRTGQLSELGNLAVVDLDDPPSTRRSQGPDVQGPGRLAHAALRLADPLELRPGLTVSQGGQGQRIACSWLCRAADFERGAGEHCGPVPQIAGRIGFVLKDGENIVRFEGGADPSAHRLAAVGADARRGQPEVRGDRDQAVAQPICGFLRADLGGRPDRDIEHDVIGARRDLLGQDGGDQLPLGVHVQFPLHAHENIVGGAEMHGAAPGDAAAFLVHHALDRGQVEIDGCQCLHGVRGAGRRGDGARGRLGHHQTVGCDDRDHDRRGPVARQSTNAVLVHDHRHVPRQAVPDVDHRCGQVDGLLLIQRQGRTGGQECGQVHVRVASRGDVLDDRLQGGRIEPVAIDASSHVCQGVQARRMGDLDGRALRDAQAFPRGLGQRRLAGRHQIAIGLIKHRQDLSPPRREQDLGAGAQTFGAADMAIGSHDRDRLVLGMQAQAPGAQGRRRIGGLVGSPGHSSNT